MEHISVSYHLLIPSLICSIGLCIICFNLKKLLARNKVFWIAAIAFFTIYLFIVGSALYDTYYYEWSLNQYDLNKDGIFSGNEINEDQKKAMQNLINDSGRNFSFITGFIFALIVSSVIYLSGRLISKNNKIKNAH
ncbi:hypothetical protein [Flavobacterium sp. C4GT6]|uniref:hypothetical protein n=1 Tax=Flavobacterium sp. C4GT6 TaxID=3103818 RepID=UPI002ED40BE6